MGSPGRAVVTGANSGLGLASTVALAAAGWAVTLAVRSTKKGDAATALVRKTVPGARLDVRRLDLSDLTSVREFAAGWDAPLELLMNNAGMMLVPQRSVTGEGFEEHMGVNHLGHYLLTALLLPQLTRAHGRVVSLSSIAHRSADRLDRGLGLAGGYSPMGAYGQSKLATLMFAIELDRRLRRTDIGVKAVAAHPGWSATDPRAPSDRGDDPSPTVWLSRKISQLLGSSAAHGARPQLYAGTAPELPGGSYCGPRWMVYGRPHLAAPSKAARSTDDARWLFDASADLTGTPLLS